MSDRNQHRGRRWVSFSIVGLFTTALVAGAPQLASSSGQNSSTGLAPGQVMRTSTPVTVVRQWSRGPMSGGVQPKGKDPGFLPTMPRAAYRAAKEAAARAPRISKTAAAGMIGSSLQRLRPDRPNVPPTEKFVNFDGVNQTIACNCRPPDPEGAVGRQHYVQVTNSHFDVYNKALPNTNVQSMTLAAHQGASEFVFDPRAMFDRTWNRYVTIATRHSTSSSDTCECFYLAVSQTGNPTGAWWLYLLGSGGFFGSGAWWDFPQLGMNQDALFVTANLFNFADSYLTTVMIPMAKARAYNGYGISAPIWYNFPGTLTPPQVVDLDQNTKSFFIANSNGPGGGVDMFSLSNAAYPSATSVLYEGQVPVGAYAVPPDAAQPGTSTLLDTGDTRFVNRSSQVGNSLWNTHTIAFGSYPAPRYYKINTATVSVVQSNFYYASGSSDDWNASITSNLAGDASTVYSSTDPPAGVQAQTRVDGQEFADPPFFGAGGVSLYTSPTFYVGGGFTTERWGDYSTISPDPVGPGPSCPAGKRQWVTNQTNVTSTVWGTRIARVGFC